MGSVFGKEKPLKEVLRENKRMINKAIRELDREKVALEREEKRLTMDIKKAAKDGQMKAVKIMAKVGSTIYIYMRTSRHVMSCRGQLYLASSTLIFIPTVYYF
jgi:charged multivesicular body protein 2A